MTNNIKKKMNNFLKSGAIFGNRGNYHVFHGDVESRELRPEGPSLYLQDFYLQKKKPWKIFENYSEYSIEEFEDFLLSLGPKIFSEKELFEGWDWIEPQEREFARQFSWIQNEFSQNHLKKAVPVVFSKNFSQQESTEVVLSCLQALPSSFQGHLYGWWNSQEVVIGLTPEVLIQQKSERTWKTMALAGTHELQSYVKDPNAFLKDEKEIQEHQWVVSFLRQQLQSYGDITLGQREVVETPTLAHFRTLVSLETPESIDLESFISSLHPTPALGCFPKDHWRDIIGDLDGEIPRFYFGAPIGMSWDTRRALIVVAIRNLQKIRDSPWVIGSGCGIVTASKRNQEWRELKNKRESVKKIFKL